MNLLKPFIVCGLSLWLTSFLLPGVSFFTWWALAITAIVLTLVQKIIRPVLGLLFLPITIVTLGLFSSFLNLFLLWLVTAIVPGFHIDPMTIFGFGFNQLTSLVLVSFVISLIQMVINRFW